MGTCDIHVRVIRAAGGSDGNLRHSCLCNPSCWRVGLGGTHLYVYEHIPILRETQCVQPLRIALTGINHAD